jgi:hypothetical protein
MPYSRIIAAAALAIGIAAQLSANAQVLYDSDYGYYGYGPYYRDHGLLDIPGDVVAGVVGGVPGDGYAYGYRPGYAYGYGSGAAACARNFRSFDPETGTYTTYAGEQVLCPYLRG